MSALHLQPAIDRLRDAVKEQNRPGSVDGLLAHHVLKEELRIPFDWQVACTQDWIDTEYKATNLDHVAALGFCAWDRIGARSASQLLEGLARINQRDAFLGEHLSIARNPTRLLGVLLGSLALGEAGAETLAWCQSTLERMQQKGSSNLDPLVSYLRYRAFGKKVALPGHDIATPYGKSFVDWAVRQGMYQTDPPFKQLSGLRQEILLLAATDLHFESASQAAFIWSSVTANLFHALGSTLLQPRQVGAILQNFEPAMKRWRWDKIDLQHPIRWEITQEREVQDILWLILRSYFSDVVDEDALPKFGHSTYKADFGIGSLKLIIETKFASSREDFKKIEKEVQEDCVPYLRDMRYESLIVFIYDDSASVQEHETTRHALLEIPGIVEVVVATRPSQLPAKTELPRRSPRRRSSAQR